MEEFIKHRYKVSDIALRELSPAFITDFEFFLRTEKNHCTNTVWSYMMPFRSIIYTAINNGWLQRDPFYTYRITKEETKRGFLTKEEITMLINGTFKKKSYELQTGRLADLPTIRQVGSHASYTALLSTSLTNRHIACLCYGSLTITSHEFKL